MKLPSNVPAYPEEVPLPDFDQIEHTIAQPREAKLRAWEKLHEAERRRLMFAWATWGQTRHPYPRFMNDLASAFLMTFESAIQILKDELKPASGKKNAGSETWLEGQPAYGIEMRGLRTLRTLEAHVRPVRLATHAAAVADTYFAGTSTGGTTAWYWRPLTKRDLGTIEYKRLDESELPTWNARCKDRLALGLMLDGLESLRDLLMAAGP